MKSPFCSLLLIALISTFPLASFAAEADSKKPKNQNVERFDIMAARMKLDDKQKQSLKPIVEKLQAQRAQTLKQLQENEQKELSKVLSEDQVKQVQRYMQFQQRNMRPQASGQRPTNKPESAKKSGAVYPRPPERLPSKQ